MPTERTAVPSFHDGFFAAHQPGTALPVTVERDANGAPCFACYFETLFDAVSVDGIDVSQVDTSELDPVAVAEVVRLAAALGYLAETLAYVIARGFEAPEQIVPIFAGRLGAAVARVRDELADAGVAPRA